jgi:uncharacterized protein YndB with AHSA1/START domain
VEPIRKQLIVEAPQERAFRVFTDGIDRWWPREHHIGRSPLKRTLIEPRLEGRWYSIHEDGSQTDVGRVLAWDPPRRLVLSWQITAQWQFDPAFVTEVEVRFTAEGARRTRVDFEHRLLERYGEAAPALREQLNKPGGWHGTLDAFARVAAEEP